MRPSTLKVISGLIARGAPQPGPAAVLKVCTGFYACNTMQHNAAVSVTFATLNPATNTPQCMAGLPMSVAEQCTVAEAKVNTC
jgi:hypothetical protein